MEYMLLIDGECVDGRSRVEVVNPATRKQLALAPRADAEQADQAVAAANRAFGPWARLGYAGRREYLERLAQAMKGQVDELSRLLTLEQGKPIDQAWGEVMAR